MNSPLLPSTAANKNLQSTLMTNTASTIPTTPPTTISHYQEHFETSKVPIYLPESQQTELPPLLDFKNFFIIQLENLRQTCPSLSHSENISIITKRWNESATLRDPSQNERKSEEIPVMIDTPLPVRDQPSVVPSLNQVKDLLQLCAYPGDLETLFDIRLERASHLQIKTPQQIISKFNLESPGPALSTTASPTTPVPTLEPEPRAPLETSSKHPRKHSKKKHDAFRRVSYFLMQLPIVSEKNPDMSSMIKMEEINKLWQVNKNTFICKQEDDDDKGNNETAKRKRGPEKKGNTEIAAPQAALAVRTPLAPLDINNPFVSRPSTEKMGKILPKALQPDKKTRSKHSSSSPCRDVMQVKDATKHAHKSRSKQAITKRPRSKILHPTTRKKGVRSVAPFASESPMNSKIAPDPSLKIKVGRNVLLDFEQQHFGEMKNLDELTHRDIDMLDISDLDNIWKAFDLAQEASTRTLTNWKCRNDDNANSLPLDTSICLDGHCHMSEVSTDKLTEKLKDDEGAAWLPFGTSDVFDSRSATSPFSPRGFFDSPSQAIASTQDLLLIRAFAP